MTSTSIRRLTVVAVAALALVAAADAGAAKQYDLASLTGVYHFNLIEIQVPTDAPIVYCNGYGQIDFDGLGEAEVTGYTVCSGGDPDTFTYSRTYTYSVDPYGSVTMTEVGEEEYPAHCQIAKGGLLLCDGTGGLDGSPPAERGLWMVTAAKL